MRRSSLAVLVFVVVLAVVSLWPGDLDVLSGTKEPTWRAALPQTGASHPYRGWLGQDSPPTWIEFFLTGRRIESRFITSHTGSAGWASHFPLPRGDVPAFEVLAQPGTAPESLTITIERDLGTLTLRGVRTGREAAGSYAWSGKTGAMRELASLGYTGLSEGDLIALTLLNISPPFLRGLRERGYAEVDGYWLRAWAISGVTLAYLDSLADLGYHEGFTPAIYEAWASGTSPSFISAVREISHGTPSLAEMTALRRSGVTEEQIRGFVTRGWTQLPPSDMARLLSSGATGDVLDGGRLLGDTAIDDIITLAVQDIDAQFIRGLRLLAPDAVSLEQAIRARWRGVVRARALGPTALWRFTKEDRAPQTPLAATALTTGRGTFYWPRVSPDGSAVAYVELAPHHRLLTMPLDGGEPTHVLESRDTIWMPAWSPGQDQLAFGSREHIWTIPAGGGTPREFRYSAWNGWITWAPLHTIVYARENLRWYSLLDPTTEDERPLRNRPSMSAERLHLSPDARWMAIGLLGPAPALVVYEWPTGGARRTVADGPWVPIGWTPDAAAVLVMASGSNGTTRVWSIRLADGHRSLYATLPVRVHAEETIASPDGTVFVAVVAGRR